MPEQQTFSSKVDAWLLLVMVASAVACTCFILLVLMEDAGATVTVIVLVTLLPGVVLPPWLLFGTRYTVSGDDLSIRSGPFSWEISVGSIRSITPTRNPLSSPALSLDRLRIDYGAGKYLLVSPADPQGFREALGYD